MNVRSIFYVLSYGSQSKIKMNETHRQFFQFAINGLKVLARERDNIEDESTFELLCARYYDEATRYCLKARDIETLVMAFAEIEIDILAVRSKYQPLRFNGK